MLGKFRDLSIVILIILTCYVALFSNDAISNVDFIASRMPLILANIFLLIIVIPISLALMDHVTGEFGLERFKRIAAISLGMTVLGFSALQFIGAIATSSAEGATVIVEIMQQMAHFSQHGELEQYGLVGMLTSDASGPWNSSIFPVIILALWLLRGKFAEIEPKQLHIPMLIQFILYAQQFFFGLDLQYTLLEILLMLITATLFVWGMLSFLVPMFRSAEKASKEAEQDIVETDGNRFFSIYKRIAARIFLVLTYNPWQEQIDEADRKVQEHKGGFGAIGKKHVVFDALQLTFAMTVAMFALVLAVQFLAVQLNMSDAEAALFGTAGLTSAPEAFVAMNAGPYVNALLLVGSNIIDGWMSAIGQTILLSYAEIMSKGAITSIPLHPAIRFLTFLSWTQGILVWGFLALYAHKIHRTTKKRSLTLLTILGLTLAVLYYFGGAWFSAQALGYRAEYALESPVFHTLSQVVEFFASQPSQQVALGLNILGLIGLGFYWTGIAEKLRSILVAQPKTTSTSQSELKKLIKKNLYREDQQVVIILDTSSAMDNKGKIFTNRWIDLVFRQTAALATLLDDDGHIPVYTADAQSRKMTKLLTLDNADEYIEKHIGRQTQGEVHYAKALQQVIDDFSDVTSAHDPVLMLFITAGEGKDKDDTIKVLKKMQDKPFFVQFLAIYGDDEPEYIKVLQDIERFRDMKIDNAGLSLLPLYKLTDATQIVQDVLNKYPKFLEEAKKKKIVRD